METRIDPLPTGFARSYLVREEGIILVDAGTSGQIRTFQQALERLSVRPQDIRLIVLTHGHADHVGSARELQALTGAPLAMRSPDRDWLEQGQVVTPPGVTPLGRFLARAMRASGSRMHFQAAQVDILAEDGLSLAEYGVSGTIYHTPGHSAGSISVLLDSGEALVGDLVMGTSPLSRRPKLPLFGDDLEQVKASLRRLLERGATTFYPGHGAPFPAARIRAVL